MSEVPDTPPPTFLFTNQGTIRIEIDNGVIIELPIPENLPINTISEYVDAHSQFRVRFERISENILEMYSISPSGRQTDRARISIAPEPFDLTSAVLSPEELRGLYASIAEDLAIFDSFRPGEDTVARFTKVPQVDELDLLQEMKKIYPNMECAGCGCHIEQPENLIEHLGTKETINYMHYCKEAEQAPLLYCCGCFGYIKNDQTLWNKFQVIFASYKRTKIKEREMDEELGKIRGERLELEKAKLEKLQEINNSKLQIARFREELSRDKQMLQYQVDHQVAQIRLIKQKYEESIAKLEYQITKEKIKNMLLDINPLAALLREKIATS